VIRPIKSLDDCLCFSLKLISDNLILALNEDYVNVEREQEDKDSETIVLNVGDEIAVIPPISGG